MKTQPIHFRQQAELNKLKRSPYLGPHAARQKDDMKEYLFADGTMYKLFVVYDENDYIHGYRLRPQPIDPDKDYSNITKDFFDEQDAGGKSLLMAAVDEFNKGNQEAQEIIERVRHTQQY